MIDDVIIYEHFDYIIRKSDLISSEGLVEYIYDFSVKYGLDPDEILNKFAEYFKKSIDYNG
jgi:hypothetical protein